MPVHLEPLNPEPRQMMIEETMVEAKGLKEWVAARIEEGADVQHIIPAHYVLVMEHHLGVQHLRMDVQTYRCLWMTLGARYARKFGDDDDG